MKLLIVELDSLRDLTPDSMVAKPGAGDAIAELDQDWIVVAVGNVAGDPEAIALQSRALLNLFSRVYCVLTGPADDDDAVVVADRDGWRVERIEPGFFELPGPGLLYVAIGNTHWEEIRIVGDSVAMAQAAYRFQGDIPFQSGEEWRSLHEEPSIGSGCRFFAFMAAIAFWRLVNRVPSEPVMDQAFWAGLNGEMPRDYGPAQVVMAFREAIAHVELAKAARMAIRKYRREEQAKLVRMCLKIRD